MHTNNGEWWFLYHPDYKNNYSSRSRRATRTGHWKKKTGNERNTKGCNGRKRILVFHEGPGNRTYWVLHEYYALQPNISASLQKPAFVICRLKLKNHEKGDTPDCSELELGPSSEIASDLGNSLVSFSATPGQKESRNSWLPRQEEGWFSRTHPANNKKASIMPCLLCTCWENLQWRLFCGRQWLLDGWPYSSSFCR